MKKIQFVLIFLLVCLFVSCSSETAVTNTPIATATDKLITPTQQPPTATHLPPTETPIPATIPPTETPIPPTATQLPPTSTAVPSPVEVIWNINGDPNPFWEPISLAVDAADNIYVVDSANNRIQVFDKDGNFLMMWGTKGSGDGEFNFHRGPGDDLGGIAIDLQGNIYVADDANMRIQKFDSNGNFLLKWGSEGTGDGQFISPLEVAVDNQGSVYVIDDRRDDVQKFDSNGNFILKFSGHGSEDGLISNTGGIAVDNAGNVYIADYGNNRVQKFDSNGNFLLKWGSYGGGNDQLDGPCDVAVDAQGNVYVSSIVPHEQTPPRIQKFDSEGHYLARWGNLGIGDGQFTSPCGIVLDSEGSVYVADSDNQNLQKFRQK